MAETKNLSGALFRVAAPKTPKHPSFTGSCVIDGRRYWIAGWPHTIQQGKRAGERWLLIKSDLNAIAKWVIHLRTGIEFDDPEITIEVVRPQA